MSSCVLTAGIVLGFAFPRPGWAERVLARLPRSGGPTPAALTTVTAPGVNAAAEPVPTARDGAESGELRALRAAEDTLFPDIPRTAPPVTRVRPAQAQKLCGYGDDTRECRDDQPPPQDPADASQNDWMVGLRMPQIGVHADSRVERFVHYFTQSTQGRKIFRTWLKRSGRYRAAVASALRERDLPQDLHALVFVESGYSPTATSTAGAAGLWQLMPETGRVYGLAVEDDYDERRSVEKSSTAAVRHLSDLYERFGSWELALAAYDMGYKALVGRVREMGSNDYWTMSSIDGALPREAVLYVPKVLAVMLILKNLDRYGFDDTHIDDPVASANLDVPPGTDLATVARASGTSLQLVRMLNPEMLTDYVPDRGSKFTVHIPGSGVGRASALLTELLDRRKRDGLEDNAPPDFDWGTEEVPPEGSHRRARRNRYGGEDVFTPFPGAPSTRRRGERMLDPELPISQEEDARPRNEDVGADRNVLFYRVGEDDSIASIARAFGAEADDIIDDNHLDPQARLQRGMILKLHVPDSRMSRIEGKRAQARLDRQDAREREDAAVRPPSAGQTGDSLERGSGGGASGRGEFAFTDEPPDPFALALGEPRHTKRGVYMLDKPHGRTHSGTRNRPKKHEEER